MPELARLANGDPPLNILIGLEGLALGGCPINALDLGRAMRRRGHHVTVFAIEEDVRVSLLPYAERCGFPVTVLPAFSGVAVLARQIRDLATRRSVDVIHVFAPWLGPAATIAAASRGRRAAVVTNWMMENVAYIPRQTPMIVGTRMLFEEAEQTHQGRVWLMEPPVDLDADRPDAALGRSFRLRLGVADDEVAVVVVSRLDSQMKAEGIGYAVEALQRLGRPKLRLIVVGDGNAYDDIAAAARRVNGNLGREAVVMAGAMQDPRPAYAGADITLGMGGSALRALAHARPLVVLGENGFAETFAPDTADYFYRFGFFGDTRSDDPVRHLAEKLEPLLDLREREELSSFGLEQVRAKFGLIVSAEKLERVYRTSLHEVSNSVRQLTGAGYVLTRAVGHETRQRFARRALAQPA